MPLAILFYLLCAQHVSVINISIFRSLRLCWWITTSVILFLVRRVLGVFAAADISWFSFCRLEIQDDRCGNSSTQSQAPEDGYINARNMLGT